MDNPYLNRKVWFFTGSQDLYGPEVLLQVEEQSRQVVAALNESAEMPFDWRRARKLWPFSFPNLNQLGCLL